VPEPPAPDPTPDPPQVPTPQVPTPQLPPPPPPVVDTITRAEATTRCLAQDPLLVGAKLEECIQRLMG
jgi:hypothetical protein